MGRVFADNICRVALWVESVNRHSPTRRISFQSVESNASWILGQFLTVSLRESRIRNMGFSKGSKSMIYRGISLLSVEYRQFLRSPDPTDPFLEYSWLSFETLYQEV